MTVRAEHRRMWLGACVGLAVGVLAAPAEARTYVEQGPLQDIVAAAVVDGGRAVLLATPGLETQKQRWRFRSLDTSDLPQPIRTVTLSASGTKLFLETGAGPVILDLTREDQHNTPMQYVSTREVSANGAPGMAAHRLPSQRFVSVRDGMARVIDDVGTVLSSSPADAARASGPEPAAEGRADRPDGAALGALSRESANTAASAGQAIVDWQFFRVTPDEALYAPVLQFARREMAFPDAFETLETLGKLGAKTATGEPQHVVADALRSRYLRLTPAERRQRCTIYFRTRSMPGSWVIEYWFYYPFDIGGLGSHLHDPEHLFVEVDKLGGTVRRVIGAGHGYIAGNNIYSADAPGALPITLPLFVMVELGKHATAVDIDRDGIFTPGLDENEYKERAKIWGVRDVIGTINNQMIAYDRTMSALRFAEDALAPVLVTSRYPDEHALYAEACCQLVPLPAGDPTLSPCRAATTECARRSVISHPDARDPRMILKEWVFPHAFLRGIYGLGPRHRLHSVGIGYAVDLYRMPGLGHIMPMPGRIGGEVFVWKQDPKNVDPEGCSDVDTTRDPCRWRVGVGVRYEQFISNLFGIFTAVRVYSPAVSDIWITFGPMVEVPILNRSNVNFQAGLSFRPYDPPRFELKLNIGLWKPKSRHFGIVAGNDKGR